MPGFARPLGPPTSSDIRIPKIDYSSYTYTYRTSLEHVDQYLEAHSIKVPPNYTMCLAMGWWTDFYREVKKLTGIGCVKQDDGIKAHTIVVLAIAKEVSKLRVPPDLDEEEGVAEIVKKARDNTCKSIW